MNPSARISLLFGALVLLVFGIVCLKQQLGPGTAPPAFISPGFNESAAGAQGHAGLSPTIFSAEPRGEDSSGLGFRQREVSPVSLDGPSSEAITFPINTTQPDVPAELPSQPNGADGIRPVQVGSPVIDSSALQLVPTVESPTTVMTIADDSLWEISLRAYGTGEYYKALFLHNRALVPRPDRIAAGIQLSTPPLDALREVFPDACPQVAGSPNRVDR